MKALYSIIITFLLLLTTTTGFAQGAKVTRAKEMMRNLNYVGAITLLNQVLEGNDNAEAKIAISECYRKVGDSENAEYWYGQVVRAPEAEPLHFLYYGQALQRNGKCDLAREWYAKFTSAVPDDVRGQYLDKACSYEEELKTKNAGIYEIKRTDFNSNLDDFGSAIYKDGVVFASERDRGNAVKREHTWTGLPFLDLYYVPYQRSGEEFVYGRPEKFSNDINSKFHDAIVSFSTDKSQVFFTRNNLVKGKTGVDDEGIIRLKILSAKSKGKDAWGDEESLAFNSDEYSCQHPTLSVDGKKLYFSSDMPGGFGGFDLYVSEEDNGRWGPPLNLGPKINTEGNEVFPQVVKSGRLYFSSDGHIGLGGLDIIYIDDLGNGEWSEPTNIGAPINSDDDDFGITFNEDGSFGFFSSDRDGGAGRDDIYSFKKLAVPVEVYVYDAKTSTPIEGAVVVDSCSGRIYTTGKKGRVFIDQKFNQCCTFLAKKETYEGNAKQGCTRGPETEAVLVEIPLRKEIKFDLDGLVFDLSTGLPLEGATVTVTDDCGGEPQTATTGLDGRFKFPLKKDCCYSVKGAKDGYFAQNIDSLCTRGKTESETLKALINLQPATISQVERPGGTQSITGDPATGGETGKPGKGDKPGKGGKGKGGKTDKPNQTEPLSPSVAGMVLNPVTGLYEDPTTGLPADGDRNGIVFKGGEIVSTGGNNVFNPSVSSVDANGNVAYLLHIYYDFDQSYIRDESVPELEKLLRLLQDNPSFIIELGSHTDSRGSNNYNDRLSQRRAEAVVRWLVEHSIERERLVPRGYGEGQTVNKCVNAIPCSEKEHQMNRRTEFKVLGCRDCVDKSKEILSLPNDNTHVDPCQGCPF